MKPLGTTVPQNENLWCHVGPRTTYVPHPDALISAPTVCNLATEEGKGELHHQTPCPVSVDEVHK